MREKRAVKDRASSQNIPLFSKNRAVIDRAYNLSVVWHYGVHLVAMKSKGQLSALRALGKRLIPAAWHPAARRINHVFESWVSRIRRPDEYEKRKRSELEFFDPEKVYELPAIARYWTNKYLTPMLRTFGFTNALECFRPYLLDVCRANASTTCRFLSIGAGSCDAEINIARWLTESGVRNFHFKCVDINGSSIEKALQSAVVHGVQDHISVSVEDLNAWMPTETYRAILAFQSLHHVLNLEKLFHDISTALHHDGYFHDGRYDRQERTPTLAGSAPNRARSMEGASPEIQVQPSAATVRGRIRQLGLFDERVRRNSGARHSSFTYRALPIRCLHRLR